MRGRVQGVGFRYFVLSTANDLDIDGEVWNRRDGGVEIHASHENEATLELFIRRLTKGPGRVDEIVRNPVALPIEPGFQISDTR